jgi:hypothetical protein
MNSAFRVCIVGQLHHVVEIVLGAAHLQDIHQPFVRAGNGFEPLNALEFPLERLAVFEGLPRDDFHRAPGAESVPSQPDPAVAPAPDQVQQLVVGDLRRRRRVRRRAWRRPRPVRGAVSAGVCRGVVHGSYSKHRPATKARTNNALILVLDCLELRAPRIAVEPFVVAASPGSWREGVPFCLLASAVTGLHQRRERYD